MSFTEIIDKDKIYAIRKKDIEFTDKKIEKTLTDLIGNALTYIVLEKDKIELLKKLSVLDGALHIDVKYYEFLIYIRYYDRIFGDYNKIGIHSSYVNFPSDISLKYDLEKFAELLGKFPQKKLNLFVYKNDAPIVITSKDYIGLIAPMIEF
mgnify:CR=1 FL=1